MKIGFIGLGIMGSRMASNLQEAGYQLILHNRTKSKATPLLERGASWAATPAEVGLQCDLLITMLSTPEVVRQVATGSEGFLNTLSPQKMWIDCSTVNPSFSKEIASKAKAKNIPFLDAPVAGTKGPAEKGELVFLVGGKVENVQHCQPLFDIMGKKTIHLGPSGNGSSMKMLINLLLAQSMVAFSEAMSLGHGMGLQTETLFNVLLNVPVTPAYLSAVRPKFESGDYEPNFPLQWIHKDVHLATLTAYEQGIPMPSLNSAKEIFANARKAGLGELDFSVLYKYLNEDFLIDQH